jgi:hypothetical protein
VYFCSEQGFLFASFKDDPSRGNVAIYKAATRDGDTVVTPELAHTVEVGYGPDMILPNKDCTILAVANEGEGVYTSRSSNSLSTGKEVSVTSKNRFWMQAPSPTVTNIEFP